MATVTTAVVATAYGGPEVLQPVEVALPAPGPGQASVAVRAVGVNPSELKIRSGAWGTDPASLPRRIGAEAAGVVTATGPEVTDVAPGDEVIAFQVSGAYARDLVVGVDALTPKPASLPWPEAGGLMLTGATAVHLLTATGVHAGDVVLVHGAAGGVGQMAIQLARLRGARVIGTASPRNHDLLRELGTEPVAYGDGLLDRVRALPGDPVTVALDLVGTDEALDASLALVADRDRIATIAAFERGAAEGVRVLGGGDDPGTEIRAAARAELAALAGERRLAVRVAETFPLTEAAAAHRFLTDGHPSGKVVLTA